MAARLRPEISSSSTAARRDLSSWKTATASREILLDTTHLQIFWEINKCRFCGTPRRGFPKRAPRYKYLHGVVVVVCLIPSPKIREMGQSGRRMIGHLNLTPPSLARPFKTRAWLEAENTAPRRHLRPCTS